MGGVLSLGSTSSPTYSWVECIFPSRRFFISIPSPLVSPSFDLLSIVFRGFLAEKEEGAGKGTPRIFRGECEADASPRHEPGVWKLRYRRKIEVLGVKGEWREREREREAGY